MTMTVEDLVQRIAQGDSCAEDSLARTFESRVRTLILIRTRDPETARDLTQDVLLATLESLRKGGLRDPGKLPAFVVGVARNIVNNYFRTRSPVPLREPLDIDLVTTHTGAGAEEEARVSEVRHEIESLDPVDRQILTMTLVDGAKPGAIAAQLGISGDVVRQRKLRATRKIALRLSQMNADSPPAKRGDPD